jgi:hypothetical protein
MSGSCEHGNELLVPEQTRHFFNKRLSLSQEGMLHKVGWLVSDTPGNLVATEGGQYLFKFSLK